ncbi:MAG TPA: hypothetical protein VFH61_15935 [Thermoleophilia bacterium]|nr:hypothetical protein [Thermoleophilia bacterium]
MICAYGEPTFGCVEVAILVAGPAIAFWVAIRARGAWDRWRKR